MKSVGGAAQQRQHLSVEHEKANHRLCVRERRHVERDTQTDAERERAVNWRAANGRQLAALQSAALIRLLVARSNQRSSVRISVRPQYNSHLTNWPATIVPRGQQVGAKQQHAAHLRFDWR